MTTRKRLMHLLVGVCATIGLLTDCVQLRQMVRSDRPAAATEPERLADSDCVERVDGLCVEFWVPGVARRFPLP